VNVDLIFDSAPLAQPAALVFGEGLAAPDVALAVTVSFPALTVSALLAPVVDVTFAVAFPALTVATVVGHDSATDRPTVGTARAVHQSAAPAEAGSTQAHAEAARRPGGPATRWGHGAAVGARTAGRHQHAIPTPGAALRSIYALADRLPPAARSLGHQDGLRDRRGAAVPRHQLAVSAGSGNRTTGWQDRHRNRRPSRTPPWQEAVPVETSRTGASGPGAPLRAGWAAPWQLTDRPRAGTRVVVVPVNPCYEPSGVLRFAALPGSSLIFVCDNHVAPPEPPAATVVVPIRRVYLVTNAISMTRVSNGQPIAVDEFSMQIDADSYTWSFDATVPYSALAALQPSGGQPVEVEISINGVPYRMIAESLTTDRTFSAWALRVRGRGRNAVLADPYADVRTFSQPSQLTAAQLIDDVLTENAVSLGWTVDFQLEDWVLPAGTFAHTGTWMSAVRSIAEAAGGYVQPHPTAMTLRVLHKYPSAPWDWASLTPDFDLPSSVVSQESIEFVDRPIYNRVFVHGERNGKLVQVTRAGTAGDALAPTVVDPLIASVVAGRQRGRAVLSDVGRQALATLSLPVLSETGVLTPGALVRYSDFADTKLGLVRSVSLTGGLQLRQMIGVQTYVAP